ncbi:LuxR C-terminal-related transcriptional regulator [Shinella sp. CPCC 101442]|uniref:helix-turn-helix transcriptional regulator n=1 Tax=Shinella sp. CPCC 101442 TaxID=2932265 RepID=UPI002152CC27|nr:LuxR C-terminal-related transcriptional regulator [Shinella sp. CPCC 101442]MCR6500825.1 LuxR C-terminal-related transcriptional regulator [Shinella sp. CPCC 101442]
MTLNLEKLDRALDRSLEAAVDPTLWPKILDEVVEATGSFGANLIPTAAIRPDVVMCTESMKPGFSQYFADGWHLNDWRLQGVPLLKKTGTARDQQYTSRDQFERHRFYRFQAKYGIGRSCIIGFASSPDEILTLTLHRTLDCDFYSDEEAVVFQRAGTRLAASARIARAMSGSRVAGMMEGFQAAGVAAVFFDRFCRVTSVTAAAEALFGPDIDVNNRVLVCHSHSTTSAIQNRMRAVIDAHWLKSDRPSGAVSVSRHGGRPLKVLVQRLGGNLPDLFAHSVGVCLITDLAREAEPNAQHLCLLFGLTAAEAAVAITLSQGMTLREIAERKGISYETVRTYLRSIFSKTDTKRQAELVKLVTRLGA